jgi:PPP family 3-phenylpropionic acid transporter
VTGAGSRLALYYAAVFAGPGVTLPFLPAFLAGRGLGAAEVAAVLVAQQIARLVSAPLAGRAADASGRRTRAAALAALAGVAASLLVAAAPPALLLPACALAGAVTAPLVPLGDAVALRAAALGLADFGRVRSVGSVAFIAGTLAGGVAVRHVGPEVVPWAMGLGFAAAAGAALALPPLEAPPARGRGRGLALLGSRAFLLLLLASGLVQGSHALHYAFSVLWWERAGIGPDLAGALWTVGVAAETLLLMFAREAAGRAGPVGLLAIGAAAGGARWTATALTTDPWLLAPLQALHALSFGATMLGAAGLIVRLVPPELGATAQSLHAALGPGLFTLALTAASGPLYARFGGRAFLAMAGAAAAALLPAMLLARAARRRGGGAAGSLR